LLLYALTALTACHRPSNPSPVLLQRRMGLEVPVELAIVCLVDSFPTRPAHGKIEVFGHAEDNSARPIKAELVLGRRLNEGTSDKIT
jgi:hypothetical protein